MVWGSNKIAFQYLYSIKKKVYLEIRWLGSIWAMKQSNQVSKRKGERIDILSRYLNCVVNCEIANYSGQLKIYWSTHPKLPAFW